MRFLDINQAGGIDGYSMHCWYRSLRESLQGNDEDDIPAEKDFIQMVVDLVRPANEAILTTADIHACGRGNEVVAILTDWQAFLDFD